MENHEFEWDKNKERINREKHKITFNQACEIFQYSKIVFVDNRKDYGESRYIAIGKNNQDFILTVVYTLRGSKIRIISARPASKKEIYRYENSNQDFE